MLNIVLQAFTAGRGLYGPTGELDEFMQRKLKITKYVGIAFESHPRQEVSELENG